MSYGTGPAPYGSQPSYNDQAPYGGPVPYPGGPVPYPGGPVPYPGGPAPYGAPNQFGQFGQFCPPPLTPDIAPQLGASFGEAVKRYFQRYAQFSGYASRSEYWWVALFNIIISVVASMFIIAPLMTSLAAGIEAAEQGEAAEPVAFSVGFLIVWGLLMIYSLATLLPNLGLTVRRLHDVGKSGAWWFIQLIPFGIGAIWFLILMASESRPDLYRPEWS